MFEPVLLANVELPDSHTLAVYERNGGYAALRKVLKEMQPVDVTEMVKSSNLRGRGGAGFPTGIKWKTVAGAKAAQKYVICNADEGDSGSFADRMGRVACWNSVMKEQDYLVKKWNEFIAA